MRQDAINASAGELATDWLRDPEHLKEIVTTGVTADCDIWQDLANALQQPSCDAVNSLHSIRRSLIKALAPRFMAQAAEEVDADEDAPDPRRVIAPLMYVNPEHETYRRKKYWEDD